MLRVGLVLAHFLAAGAVCPPEGFDTQGALEGGFNVNWYANGTWFIQQQMPIIYRTSVHRGTQRSPAECVAVGRAGPRRCGFGSGSCASSEELYILCLRDVFAAAEAELAGLRHFCNASMHAARATEGWNLPSMRSDRCITMLRILLARSLRDQRTSAPRSSTGPPGRWVSPPETKRLSSTRRDVEAIVVPTGRSGALLSAELVRRPVLDRRLQRSGGLGARQWRATYAAWCEWNVPHGQRGQRERPVDLHPAAAP